MSTTVDGLSFPPFLGFTRRSWTPALWSEEQEKLRTGLTSCVHRWAIFTRSPIPQQKILNTPTLLYDRLGRKSYDFHYLRLTLKLWFVLKTRLWKLEFAFYLMMVYQIHYRTLWNAPWRSLLNTVSHQLKKLHSSWAMQSVFQTTINMTLQPSDNNHFGGKRQWALSICCLNKITHNFQVLHQLIGALVSRVYGRPTLKGNNSACSL